MFRWATLAEIRHLSLGFAGCLIGFLAACGSAPKSEVPFPPSPLPRPAAAYAGYNPRTGILSIGNGLVAFRWSVKSGGPGEYQYQPTGRIFPSPQECQFQIGHTTLATDNGTLRYKDYEFGHQPGGERRLTLIFDYGQPKPQLEVRIEYAVAPRLPGFRKQITLRNLTDQAFLVENIRLLTVDTEGLTLFQADGTPLTAVPQTWFCYGVGDDGTAAAWLHEAPSVLKSWDRRQDHLILGLPSEGQTWQTRLRLVGEETLTLPAVHVLYGEDWDATAVLTAIRAYADRFLPPAIQYRSPARAAFLVHQETPIADIPKPPDETDLILVEYAWEMEEAAQVKLRRFQSLMKEIGFLFGLQIALPTFPDSEAVQPEWAYQKAPQEVWQLSADNPQKAQTVYCLASDYALFIGTALADLAKEWNLDALVLTGPVLGDPEAGVTGCTAFGHDHYGKAEFAWKCLENLALIVQFLHHECPDLRVIASPDLWGVPQDDTAFLIFDQILGEPSETSLWGKLYLKQQSY